MAEYDKNSATAFDIISSFRAALGHTPVRYAERDVAGRDLLRDADVLALARRVELCLYCESVPHSTHWCDGLTEHLKRVLVNNGFLTAEQFDLMTPEALQACLHDRWEKDEHPIDDE